MFMRSQFSYTYRHLELTIITKDFPVLIRITKPEPKLKGIPVFGYAGMIRNVCKNVLDESFQPFFFIKGLYLNKKVVGTPYIHRYLETSECISGRQN